MAKADKNRCQKVRCMVCKKVVGRFILNHRTPLKNFKKGKGQLYARIASGVMNLICGRSSVGFYGPSRVKQSRIKLPNSNPTYEKHSRVPVCSHTSHKCKAHKKTRSKVRRQNSKPSNGVPSRTSSRKIAKKSTNEVQREPSTARQREMQEQKSKAPYKPGEEDFRIAAEIQRYRQNRLNELNLSESELLIEDENLCVPAYKMVVFKQMQRLGRRPNPEFERQAMQAHPGKVMQTQSSLVPDDVKSSESAPATTSTGPNEQAPISQGSKQNAQVADLGPFHNLPMPEGEPNCFASETNSTCNFYFGDDIGGSY